MWINLQFKGLCQPLGNLALLVKTYPTGDDIKPNKLLSESVQLYILHIVLQNPSIYLWELQSELCSSLHIDISIASLCHFLKKNNFSRKKM